MPSSSRSTLLNQSLPSPVAGYDYCSVASNEEPLCQNCLASGGCSSGDGSGPTTKGSECTYPRQAGGAGACVVFLFVMHQLCNRDDTAAPFFMQGAVSRVEGCSFKSRLFLSPFSHAADIALCPTSDSTSNSSQVGHGLLFHTLSLLAV